VKKQNNNLKGQAKNDGPNKKVMDQHEKLKCHHQMLINIDEPKAQESDQWSKAMNHSLKLTVLSISLADH
jgi:hypothetical protein